MYYLGRSQNKGLKLKYSLELRHDCWFCGMSMLFRERYGKIS